MKNPFQICSLAAVALLVFLPGSGAALLAQDQPTNAATATPAMPVTPATPAMPAMPVTPTTPSSSDVQFEYHRSDPHPVIFADFLLPEGDKLTVARL